MKGFKKEIMKNALIKIPVAALALSIWAVSCKSTAPDPATLPKDIAERPVDEASQKYDGAQLDKMRVAIEMMASKEKCSDASQWTFAPIGIKACGGPVSYLTFPKKSEKEIRSRIEDYNRRMSEFNKKYSIVSDCMLAAEPTGVKCQNEKAVLIY